MRAEQHHLAHALAKEQVHVLRVDEGQRDTEHRREREQDVTGEPAVRGVDPHLAQDLEPFTDDVREVLENLREVAAGFPLDEHRGRKEANVERRHANGQVVERVLERQTEVLLVEGLAKLRADRVRHLVGDHLQPGREGMAGLQGAGDQVEPLRELLFEGRSRRVRLKLRNTNGSAKPAAAPTGSAYFDRAIMPATSAISAASPTAIRRTPLSDTLSPVASIHLPRADPLVVP